MVTINRKEECCGCHACENICPVNAIKMEEDEHGFWYPKIDTEKCINCGKCDKACPIKNNTQKKCDIKAYACMNKDIETRLESSSGGIFSLLAEEIIDRGGVVFGAAFDSDFNVEHIVVENKESLELLRGSKYVQSKIGKTYELAKKYLDEDRYVLFTGTPCQIEGVYTYLGKEYDKLYTQDIICHGVPSPKVWQEYLKYREGKSSDKTAQVNFRKKDNGWSSYALSIKYNNSEYKINHKDDLFMKVFLKNVILRDSCYECSFKKKERNSDITLADFWGIKNVIPQMNDDKGTSLVIVNSEKGKELFSKINDKIQCEEVDFEEAIKYNPSMIKSVSKAGKREEFFKELNDGNMSFDEIVKRNVPKDTFKMKIKRVIKKILRKIKK